jgi:hypothetical protein
MSFGRGRPFKVILRLIHKDKCVKRLFLNLSQNDADLILKIPLDEFGITKLSPKSSKVSDMRSNIIESEVLEVVLVRRLENC